jgi:hypothetical protein
LKLFFGGAEAPTLRRRLSNSGTNRFSVSYWHLRDRLPKSKEFPFKDRFPPGSEILLDSGGYTANKKAEVDEDYWVDYLNDYIDLVSANYGYLSLVTEFDFLLWSIDDIWALRFDVFSKLPEDVFLPVWHQEHGPSELVRAAKAFPQVAIAGTSIETVASRLPGLSNKFGTRFHGLSVSSDDLLRRSGFSSVSSTAWTSPSRYGDRVIWDGRQLTRYSKDRTGELLRDHKPLLLREGFSIDLLEIGEPEEVTKLTVWSYESWAESVTRRVSRVDSEEIRTNEETPIREVDAQGAEERKLPVARTPEPQLLPILGTRVPRVEQMSPDGGSEEVEGPPEIVARSATSRVCDTCRLASLCPEYRPGSTCAYEIPIEIKTKEQLTATMTALVEIQAQRATFESFAEGVEGGHSKAASAELDRFFDLVSRMKEIQDNRDFLEISVKAHGQAGVFSRLFGSDVGSQMKELESPVPSDVLMAEVLE